MDFMYKNVNKVTEDVCFDYYDPVKEISEIIVLINKD